MVESKSQKKNKDESQYGSTKIKLKRKIPILVFSTQCSESIIDNHIIWQHWILHVGSCIYFAFVEYNDKFKKKILIRNNFKLFCVLIIIYLYRLLQNMSLISNTVWSIHVISVVCIYPSSCYYLCINCYKHILRFSLTRLTHV